MAPEHRPEDAVEEAPAGASSEGTPALSDAERIEAERRSGDDRRAGPDQRAGAAAYAAAQGSHKRKATAPASGAPASEPDGGAEEPTAETAEDEAQAQDDGGQQVQQDLHELATKAEKADEYLALAQRTQADFENYRKRAAREAELAQGRGIAKLVKQLLPAIDNLDRALKAVSEDQSQLIEGIKLVHSDLLGALQRVGVEPFSPAGEPFDPQFHEAVAQQPIEGVESGLVAEVFQQGFRLGESVLRPARVLVAA
ncbi:MAG TPA: nucleotide exchange factor GrpE [Solirubrobacteraceae bacterium]|jgi:molecular chaperone GrpE|nr:nucleotide exchange factor GrpE [Solirubrobacteraceae bacterium]